MERLLSRTYLSNFQGNRAKKLPAPLFNNVAVRNESRVELKERDLGSPEVKLMRRLISPLQDFTWNMPPTRPPSKAKKQPLHCRCGSEAALKVPPPPPPLSLFGLSRALARSPARSPPAPCSLDSLAGIRQPCPQSSSSLTCQYLSPSFLPRLSLYRPGLRDRCAARQGG